MDNIYNWLLVKKDGSWFGSFNRSAIKKPECGDSNYEWIEWNKTLPVMNDPETGEIITYKYENEELRAV